MHIFTKKHFIFILLLIFFLAWGYLLSIYGPEEIVQFFGIEFVLIFLFSLLLPLFLPTNYLGLMLLVSLL